MIQIVDNYDSFTYNLVQRLGEINPGLDIRVDRNDEISVAEIEARKPDQRVAGSYPLLGVCLGHQSIGQAFGAKIVRADQLMHGKTDMIRHNGGPLFAGLDNPFQATRYHSLIIQPDTLPKELQVIAWAEGPDGEREIMAVAHRDYTLYGLQFHPESFLTYAGSDILRNFLAL